MFNYTRTNSRRKQVDDNVFEHRSSTLYSVAIAPNEGKQPDVNSQTSCEKALRISS